MSSERASQKGVGQYAGYDVQVDPRDRAARTSLRPPAVGIGGSFRKSLRSGVVAAGLTGALPIWEMRWGNPTLIAIVRKVRFHALVSSTAFTSTAADSSFSFYRAQGFSALDGTNGTYAGFTKPFSGCVSTKLSSSQFSGDTTALRPNNGGIVILNTSASGLTGGTKILDDDPLSVILNPLVASAAAETSLITPTYLIDPAEGPTLNPQELRYNEGLVLNCDAISATGTWRFSVEVCWDEVDPGRYYDGI